MATETVIKSLLQRGLISTGTIVGVAASNHKHKQRYVIREASCNPGLQLTGVALDNNQSHSLECNSIVEIDGMELERYLLHADLDSNGAVINRGKKRGRRPKNRVDK